MIIHSLPHSRIEGHATILASNAIRKDKTNGSYTLFLTGSAAEFHWPKLIKIVAQQDRQQLSDRVSRHDLDNKNDVASNECSNSSTPN